MYSRKYKSYSVFLSAKLPDIKLERSKILFNDLAKDAMNFQTATHLVVQETHGRTTEISGKFCSKILMPLKVFLDEGRLVESSKQLGI